MGNKSRRAVTSAGDEAGGRGGTVDAGCSGDDERAAPGRKEPMLCRLRSQLARKFGSSVDSSSANTRGVPREAHPSPCKRLAQALSPNCWLAGSSSTESSSGNSSSHLATQAREIQRQQQVVESGNSDTKPTAGSSRLITQLSSPSKILFRRRRWRRQEPSGAESLPGQVATPSKGTERKIESSNFKVLAKALRRREDTPQESDSIGGQLRSPEPLTNSAGVSQRLSGEFKLLHSTDEAGLLPEPVKSADTNGNGLCGTQEACAGIGREHYANESTLEGSGSKQVAWRAAAGMNSSKRDKLATQRKLDWADEADANMDTLKEASNEKCSLRQVKRLDKGEEEGPLIQQLAPATSGELSQAAAEMSKVGGAKEQDGNVFGKEKEKEKPLKLVQSKETSPSAQAFTPSGNLEASAMVAPGEQRESLSPLIKALASSCSSLASSSSSSSPLSLAALKSSPSSSSQEPLELPASNSPGTSQVRRRSSAAKHSSKVVVVQSTAAGVASESTPTPSSKVRPRLVRAPSSGVAGALKSNFRKLVKRQQSVDSYRMARELKSKQKRERSQRPKHQSNEAIPNEQQPPRTQIARLSRKLPSTANREVPAEGDKNAPQQKQTVLQILVDPYARPGSFEPAGQVESSSDNHAYQRSYPKAVPPSSLPLVPAGGISSQLVNESSNFKGCSGNLHSSAHHLSSPNQNQYTPKKFSNASTLSSSLAADLSRQTTTAGSYSQICPSNQQASQRDNNTNNIHSSTESSLLLLHLDPQRATTTPTPTPSPHLNGELYARSPQPVGSAGKNLASKAAENENLYDNKCGLGEDMKFLASLPELCDITFLVGETREPVCAVKSVLAARSRVFHKILFGNRVRRKGPASSDVTASSGAAITGSGAGAGRRRGSSAASRTAGKSSSPIMMSSGPAQRKQSSPSNQRDWSVQADASGYSGTSPVPSHTEEGPGSATAGRLASRVSVTSGGGRIESGSFSQASTGSQQPLVIGPGQTATPAPPQKRLGTKKGAKGSIRGEAGRLSRMFMKRASDPTIKQQSNSSSGPYQALANQNYLDKMSSSQMSTTMIIEEFEPDVFRQLIEYIHTGCVLLQARTLLGLLNAADYYGLEQLRRACLRFVSCCITVDTVCSLLSTAERYIQYKCTKTIVQRVLEFVDSHADEIFKLNAFGLLPEHVVRLILARDGLKADEQAKFSGVYTWCEHYCRSYELTDISNVMQNFLDLIQFHKISRSVLLQEIYPTRIVPDNVILIALAYQANPQYFEPQPMQARRMTLPNPSCLRSSSSAGRSDEAAGQQLQPTDSCEPDLNSGGDLSASPHGVDLHKVAAEADEQQQQQQQSATGTRKSASQDRRRESRPSKGNIAQVSLSNVIRLSHKLSIKKRHSNATPLSSSDAAPKRKLWRPSASNNPWSSRQSSSSDLRSSKSHRKRLSLAKQQSALPSSAPGKADPVQLGQQILDAYLEQRKREEREREQQAAKASESSSGVQRAASGDRAGSDSQLVPINAYSNPAVTDATSGHKSSTGSGTLLEQVDGSSMGTTRQALVKSASSRKSFKDFKNISKRIFMRHSSNKLQQQTSSSASYQPVTGISPPPTTIQDKRRKLLKIKRSETVFETTTR